jgi:hypothetical protein
MHTGRRGLVEKRIHHAPAKYKDSEMYRSAEKIPEDEVHYRQFHQRHYHAPNHTQKSAFVFRAEIPFNQLRK